MALHKETILSRTLAGFVDPVSYLANRERLDSCNKKIPQTVLMPSAKGFCLLTRMGTCMCIECFHSRGQHLCKFIGTKESVCIRREFHCHRTGLHGTPTWPPFHCFGTPIWPP